MKISDAGPPAGPPTFLMFADLLFSLTAVLILILFLFLIEERSAAAERGAAEAAAGAAEEELRHVRLRVVVAENAAEAAEQDAAASQSKATNAAQDASDARGRVEALEDANGELEKSVESLSWSEVVRHASLAFARAVFRAPCPTPKIIISRPKLNLDRRPGQPQHIVH